MTNMERYYTSKLYLEKLSQGENPFTGEDLPFDSVLNDVTLCRAFNTAVEALDMIIKNGGTVTRQKKRTRPFFITDEQRGRIVITETPVVISEVCNRVQAVLDDDVCTISPVRANNWLETQGLLKTELDENGQKNRVVTDEGEKLGIETRDGEFQGRVFKKNYYSLNAQAFLIANLDAIAAHKVE